MGHAEMQYKKRPFFQMFFQIMWPLWQYAVKNMRLFIDRLQASFLRGKGDAWRGKNVLNRLLFLRTAFFGPPPQVLKICIPEETAMLWSHDTGHFQPVTKENLCRHLTKNGTLVIAFDGGVVSSKPTHWLSKRSLSPLFLNDKITPLKNDLGQCLCAWGHPTGDKVLETWEVGAAWQAWIQQTTTVLDVTVWGLACLSAQLTVQKKPLKTGLYHVRQPRDRHEMMGQYQDKLLDARYILSINDGVLVTHRRLPTQSTFPQNEGAIAVQVPDGWSACDTAAWLAFQGDRQSHASTFLSRPLRRIFHKSLWYGRHYWTLFLLLGSLAYGGGVWLNYSEEHQLQVARRHLQNHLKALTKKTPAVLTWPTKALPYRHETPDMRSQIAHIVRDITKIRTQVPGGHLSALTWTFQGTSAPTPVQTLRIHPPQTSLAQATFVATSRKQNS